ncbi:pyridoxal-phosphate dependent enzyme [Luteimonas yindakuii]|uniref:pyridoxal-phosphate dependent enzyme n=1 Tax=Luteimonas yindakuii TaxID=2565782 RepID=UPI0010A3242C|nr:pyridoxal-phosphate dependent enzyme [Luteimonas yindakuii]QCO66594.1 pyridoxal-phosphate dependent enzyme [Luteimonas yindakuii]
MQQPTFDDVLDAAARIAPHAHVTPVLRSRSIDALAGCSLYFKAEHLQRVGAFKFRGACNAVWALEQAQAVHGVVTHSSGNHGAALALAALSRGIPCHVVAPSNAVPAKLAAIAGYGAALHRCEPTLAAREAACATMQQHTGATLVHPYEDPRVIAGQGTAVLELLAASGPLDVVVVPVGGGGLAAGTALALAGRAPGTRLVLAEPAGADDAARSLAAGRRITDIVPDTVCDGLRAAIGRPNSGILQAAGVEVVTVDDQAALDAMRLVWQRMKQLIEPSAAVTLAAVLAAPDRFAGQRVGVILSGGNADLAALVRMDAE